MNRRELNRLKSVYRQNHSSPLKRELLLLYEYYGKINKRALIDVVAATGALGVLLSNQEVDLNELSPQMIEAFQLQYPNVDLVEVLENGDIESYMNGWKGKYFEVLVRDELNNGSVVGDIQLKEGQIAELAESPTQPGWDLQIQDADGYLVQEIQLKATQSLSYVKRALQNYPDIPVLTTVEALDNGMGQTNILSSDMSVQQLETDISNSAADATDFSLIEDLGDAIIPGLPFLIIAATEGKDVLMGKKELDSAIKSTTKRSAKSGISLGTGAAAAAMLDGGIISVPVTIGTKMSLDRLELYKELNEKVDKRRSDLDDLLLDYS